MHAGETIHVLNTGTPDRSNRLGEVSAWTDAPIRIFANDNHRGGGAPITAEGVAVAVVIILAAIAYGLWLALLWAISRPVNAVRALLRRRRV